MRRLVLCLPLAACGPSDADDPPPDAPTWHGDVAPIVRAYCGDCHVEGGVAPMPLTRPEHLVTYEAAVMDAIDAGRMPPWLAAPGVRDYLHDESMPRAAAEALRRWYAAGAPEGDPGRPAPAIPRTRSRLSRVDVAFALPEAYAPAAGRDDYRCFAFEWPHDEDRFVTGFAVAPSNAAIAHHAVAFLFGPADAGRADEMDAADPGPGYRCYGAPYVGRPVTSQFLGAWAPGGAGLDFPAGTGIRVRPGSRVVLQMHYSAHGAPPAPDRTELRFSLADAVEREAWFLPWFDLGWVLRPDSMTIPAGARSTTHEFTGAPAEAPIARFVLPGVDLAAGFTIHSVAPHMHQRGVSERVDLLRDDGDVALLHIPRWDFDWQRTYFFAAPQRVAPGDRLRVRCTWDNSAPGATDVRWGESTGDEMCATMFYVTRE